MLQSHNVLDQSLLKGQLAAVTSIEWIIIDNTRKAALDNAIDIFVDDELAKARGVGSTIGSSKQVVTYGGDSLGSPLSLEMIQKAVRGLWQKARRQIDTDVKKCGQSMTPPNSNF